MGDVLLNQNPFWRLDINNESDISPTFQQPFADVVIDTAVGEHYIPTALVYKEAEETWNGSGNPLDWIRSRQGVGPTAQLDVEIMRAATLSMDLPEGATLQSTWPSPEDGSVRFIYSIQTDESTNDIFYAQTHPVTGYNMVRQIAKLTVGEPMIDGITIPSWDWDFVYSGKPGELISVTMVSHNRVILISKLIQDMTHTSNLVFLMDLDARTAVRIPTSLVGSLNSIGYYVMTQKRSDPKWIVICMTNKVVGYFSVLLMPNTDDYIAEAVSIDVVRPDGGLLNNLSVLFASPLSRTFEVYDIPEDRSLHRFAIHIHFSYILHGNTSELLLSPMLPSSDIWIPMSDGGLLMGSVSQPLSMLQQYTAEEILDVFVSPSNTSVLPSVATHLAAKVYADRQPNTYIGDGIQSLAEYRGCLRRTETEIDLLFTVWSAPTFTENLNEVERYCIVLRRSIVPDGGRGSWLSAKLLEQNSPFPTELVSNVSIQSGTVFLQTVDNVFMVFSTNSAQLYRTSLPEPPSVDESDDSEEAVEDDTSNDDDNDGGDKTTTKDKTKNTFWTPLRIALIAIVSVIFISAMSYIIWLFISRK